MPPTNRLLAYFTDGLDSYSFADRVGTEVETSFVNAGSNQPITVATSQNIFCAMVDAGWNVTEQKGELLTELTHPDGDRMLYELGRSNIELSLAPQKPAELVRYTHLKLEQLCRVAGTAGAAPWEKPILPGAEDLLVIPDERDATWLDLDGREALKLLTRCSAVQFTIDVPPDRAIAVINNLNLNLTEFLRDYPQEAIWRRYIAESKADYRADRYGGPSHFDSLEHYCEELVKHDAIVSGQLVPHDQVDNLNIPMFIRSVWWYFRLRRFGRKLCVEIRPLPRLGNNDIADQLTMTGRLARGWDQNPHSDTVRCQCDKCFFSYDNIIYQPKAIRDWWTPQIYHDTEKQYLF